MQFTISLMPPVTTATDDGSNNGVADDQRLPTARACFFEFHLPRYTTIQVPFSHIYFRECGVILVGLFVELQGEVIDGDHECEHDGGRTLRTEERSVHAVAIVRLIRCQLFVCLFIHILIT
jgi:hypothetical protein